MSLARERYKQSNNTLHATYAFNTWVKRKRPAKTFFLIHIVHDNLKKEPRSLILFSKGSEDQVVPGDKSPSTSQGNNWVLANLILFEGVKQTPSRFMLWKPAYVPELLDTDLNADLTFISSL